MPREYFHVNDFRGGMNVDTAAELLAANELVLADNCDLDRLGAITKRPGADVMNMEAYAQKITQVIEWVRSNGTVTLLAVSSDDTTYAINKVDEDTGALTLIRAVASPKVGWCALNVGGSDRLYFVDGSELYVYDGTTCEAVTPNAAADNDLTPIRKCKWLVYNPRSYRIYAAGNPDAASRLYYSEANDITYFKNTSFLVPTGSDGPVTALAVFAHALLVFYSDSLRAWKGTDPTDATWTAVPVPYGTNAPDTVCLTPNSLTWLSRSGLICLNPAILDYNLTMLPGEELVTDISRGKVSSLVRGIKSHATCCAIYDTLRNRYLLAYTEMDQRKMLVLNWELKAYTRYTGLGANCLCARKSGDIAFGSDGHIGVIRAEPIFVGVDCWGVDNEFSLVLTPIKLDVHTGWSNLQRPMMKKRLHKLFIVGHSENTADSHLGVKIKSVGSSTNDLGNVIFSIEGMSWGDAWGGMWPASELQTVELRARTDGERFQLMLTNAEAGASISIYGYLYEYALKHKPKGVKANG